MMAEADVLEPGPVDWVLCPPANQRIPDSAAYSHIAQEHCLLDIDSSEPPDNFRFVESSHPRQVLSILNELRLSGTFCDVVIRVEDAEFPCHRLVLAAFSPYFKAMFSSDLAESSQASVAINGVEAQMVELLIDYAYTSEVIITRGNVQSLLAAANLLVVLSVREACCHFMERSMDVSNCLGIHCFAETHACDNLQQKAKVFALRCFSEVCKHDELNDLERDKLIEFLSDDDLNVESEESVFWAVIDWYQHDKDARTQDFDKVLDHVRLPLVSPYFLHDFVEVQEVIQQSAACQKLVLEAQKYHLLVDRRGELRSSRTRPRKAAGMSEVIIAVGGEDDKVVLRSVESYEPQNQHWRTLASLPFAISKHGLVANGHNQLYLVGGEFADGSASRSMWRYDPGFDSWLELASLNMPRSELGLAMLDGYVYAVGGWEGYSRLDSVERCNLATNQWAFVAPMKMAVTSPAVVALNGLLYVTGGAVLEDGDGIDMVQMYNPHHDQWTELSPMLIPRSGSAACTLNGYIYIIGGWHASTENTSKVERFDPRTNTWQQVAPLCERRYRPGVAVVDGKVYVCGGEEGWDRYHDTIERYDEETDSWEVVGEMPTSRSWLSCVAMTIQLGTEPDLSVERVSCFV